ncbi:NEL-type E3 ubiquitin ligase domain-containing protein [Pseudomonas sp. K1(2024)]|uniref:RING-type E3 ubiquitin transferase n=1 Tax=Pseudomonas boreofloridensis TaxID=3064348 RepID=A0ABV4Z6W2_9PSED|nr:NEL-type E3 ubiquitin ligase domain-containing protein [Pseudomonas sp. K13]MDO7902212.1 NEL-type E3 ubiquitin ligase domain-containing protein [Pseudomonas sp. K13]
MTPPLHQRQILTALPNWSTQLHADHARQLMASQRKPYLDAQGQPLAWYAAAPDSDQRALDNALEQRDGSLRELQGALAGLQGVTEFCRPLLQARVPRNVSVDRTYYRSQAARVEQPGSSPQHMEYTPTGKPRLSSLLEAALHNFAGPLDTPAFSSLQCGDDPRVAPPLSLREFITLCREVDLGRRYQEHLASIYDTADAQRIHSLSIQARQDELRVQTRLAQLKNDISQRESVALHAFCVATAPSNCGFTRISCQRLELFGIPLHELLLLTLHGPAGNRHILYLPGIQTAALRSFASLPEAHADLVCRLKQATQRRALLGLAPLSLQPELATHLRRALYSNPNVSDDSALQPRDQVHLQAQLKDLPDMPWTHLQQLHLQRIKGDARCVAVPTADVDAQARLRRLAFWEDIGLSVLNVAAAFIPALNPLMLWIAGSQLVGGLFYAIQSWEAGDTAQALAQVESLLVNVAIAGVSVGAAKVVGARLVDDLQPIEVNERPLLWRPDLEHYRSAATLPQTLAPDAQGLYWQQGRSYIRLQQSMHEVVSDTQGQWYVRHPSDEQAYRPPLQHNGRGAWRLAYDNPLEWETDELLARQGSVGESLSAAQRNAALQITGLSADVLRRQLIDGAALPSPLEDLLLRLEGRETALPQGTSAAARLSAQFPELPACALDELLDHASPAERRRMAPSDGRIPLRVLEEARLLQATIRLNRAILGLYQQHLATRDTALLRSGLSGGAVTSDAELFAVAVNDRTRASHVLGQQRRPGGFRSPLRLSEGRLGYPLSGRGTPLDHPTAAQRRLARLFPAASPSQLQDVQRTLIAAGDLGQGLLDLERQWQDLHQTLLRWKHSEVRLLERDARIECARRLYRAWRRETDGELVLDRMALDELPELTTVFPTIRHVRIDSLGLLRLPAKLFECFPALESLSITGNFEIDSVTLAEALQQAVGVRRLDLSSNALTDLGVLAPALRAMPHLRHLVLSRNALRLSVTDVEMLAQRRLDSLDLHNNRIQLDAATAEAFQGLIDLRELDLSINPLTVAPDVSYMARLSRLDLSRANLDRWPDGLILLMSQLQYQLRQVDLSFNNLHSLEALDTVLATPFMRDVAQQRPGLRLSLHYNLMDEAPLSRLRRSGLTVYEHDEVRASNWQQFYLDGRTDERIQLWNELHGMPENQALFEQLQMVTDSAQAQRQPQAMSARAWAILEQAAADTRLRDQLNAVAESYPVTCGDAGTDALSALETELYLHQLANDPTPLHSKWQALRKVYRRSLVNRLADRIALARTLRKAALQAVEAHASIPSLDPLDDPEAVPDTWLRHGLVDDIEIRLALRQSLAVILDYPEPEAGMLYESTANLTPTVRNKVVKEVRRLEESSNLRRAWLLEQPTWRYSVRRAHEQAFSTSTDFWQPGMDYLDSCVDALAPRVDHLSASVKACLEQALGLVLPQAEGRLSPVSLTDAQYTQAANALLAEQQRVELGLFDSFTREVEQA